MRVKHKLFILLTFMSACIIIKLQNQMVVPKIKFFLKKIVDEVNTTPPLYLITPTFKRAEQLAELTRMGYVLRSVPNLHWLVIEDDETLSPQVVRVLEKINISYAYLTGPMPAKYRARKVPPRGVSNRNRGLEWIRANATEGVFYFADNDNVYDLEIFEQMRYTKKISMFPVGLIGLYGVSSPMIANGKFTGFYDSLIAGRKFPIDMGGFAVNVKFFLERPGAAMSYNSDYQENGFLVSLAPFNLTEIEFLANVCTEVLVWHTKTVENHIQKEPLDQSKYGGSNLETLTLSVII